MIFGMRMYKDSLFQNCSPVCPNVTIAQAVQRQHICIRFFQFPLTSEAYQQYLVLENSINNIVFSDQSDVWQYIYIYIFDEGAKPPISLRNRKV
jgi:hypothetical protein